MATLSLCRNIRLGVTFRSFRFLSVDPGICRCQDCLQIGYGIGTNKLCRLHLGGGMRFWCLWVKFGFKGQGFLRMVESKRLWCSKECGECIVE
jgi:hypothetical protein